jgi:lysyl-tRNA synthetase class 2
MSAPSNEQIRLKARSRYLVLRARLIHLIRRFLAGRGYLEVETPLLIPAPAPEAHIDAVNADGRFLHTSPELCMKRLLAAGYDRIFQITKCFRKSERGARHLPEFTLLEWYCTGADYRGLMDECEELIPWLAWEMGLKDRIPYQGRQIDLKCPWERLLVGSAFDRYASVPMLQALEADCFSQVLAEEIEPHLGLSRPVFLYDYPAPQASLARLKEEDPSLCERFELYLAGLELANGFSELTDPREQRARFEREMAMRLSQKKQVYPTPEKFLTALEHMPVSAGIALGVDRLVMLFSDTTRIDDVVSFTPDEL